MRSSLFRAMLLIAPLAAVSHADAGESEHRSLRHRDDERQVRVEGYVAEVREPGFTVRIEGDRLLEFQVPNSRAREHLRVGNKVRVWYDPALSIAGDRGRRFAVSRLTGDDEAEADATVASSRDGTPRAIPKESSNGNPR